MKTDRRIAEAPWRALIVIAMLLLLAVPPGYAAQCPPNIFPGVVTTSLTDPQAGLSNLFTFNNPILDSTKLLKYATPVPNPLAPGFIYTPNGTQGGETLYTVSMREITQSLGVVYNNPADTANNGCTAAPNTVWTYGDARDNGVTTAPTAAHSFPGPTFELMSNVPHRVLWTNELPNIDPRRHPANVDPTLDCGPNAPGCFPFNRVVPHVHGAHVADDSDGNPDQWFNPGWSVVGHNWRPNTHIPGATLGTYRYENTQDAATVWYHDHAMGLTHLNVFAGLAGFNIIRDANELAMQTPPAGGGPAVLPKYPFENLLAIQDRVFDTSGKMYSPDRPIQDQGATLTGVACDATLPTVVSPANPVVSPYACAAANLVGGTGNILLPTTPCDPAASIVAPVSPYACPVKYFTVNPDGSLVEVPTGTTPPAGAVTFPSITGEYWGNVILVNGQVWPKQDVEKRVYRFRWLNGSDSRSYVLRLVDAVTKQPIPGLDIWQIGTDQGFLNAPVKVMINDPSAVAPPAVAPFPQTNGIVIMPGERVDVLIDFKNVPAGTTQVLLQNLGPEFPYTGEYPPNAANGQTPSAIVPEVMLFNVLPTLSATPDTMTPSAITSLRTPIVPLNTTVGTPVRTIYLAERVDRFGRLTLTLNGVDYMSAIDEFIKLGDTEEWDVVNLTPDGHPMHPHQVAFQVINRQDLIDPATGLPFAAPMNLPLVNTPVSAQFTGVAPNPALPTATGAIYPPEANEVNAWKDTIFMPPGKVTRIRATWDIPGLYVFHCHILSHEENDMMRPVAVVTPAASVQLTASPASQAAGAPTMVTLNADAKTGIAAHTDSNAFEYQFTVTAPGGATTVLTPMSMVPPTSTPGYTMVRQVTWTPPAVPGTYQITVTAKPMGQAPSTANSASTTLSYTVAAAAVSGATSTTGTGYYKAGSSVNVSLSFNQPVSSTGLAIALNNGVTVNTGALANATSFSGSFVVAAGQDTPAGKFLEIASITGSITDASGNVTANPAVPAGANISNMVQIVTDTTAPVSSTTVAAGTYAGSVTVGLTANEPATIYYTTDGSIPTTASTIYTAPIVLASSAAATLTVKFFAVDKAGNVETTVKSASYTIHVADLVAKIALNNGSLYTNSVNASLSLSASDVKGVASYAISTDGVNFPKTVAISPVVTVFSAKNIAVTLPAGDGLKTVYVRFTDGLGVVYPPVTAQITLETQTPTVSITPAPGTYAGKISVALFSPNEPEGATIYYTTNGSTPSKSSAKYSSPISLSGAGQTVTVKYFAVDMAGNVGAVQTATYSFVAKPDMTADCRINNNAFYTNSRNVVLNVTASDPIGGGVATMSFSEDGINFTAPVPYAQTAALPWKISSSGDGVKTVYFRLTDKGTQGVAPITYTFTDKIILAEGVKLACGDLDGDGKVDLADVSKALAASAGLRKLLPAEQARADVGPLVQGKPVPDGEVSTGDVMAIMQKVVGLAKF
ncbi:hypothetical protein GMST_18920 [Geomonas silvestris]|uniref:Multicopper oxidase n=1 Tax=Geomonas silvestris TaxID=2740184 RepID=A0A6V8MHX5_9BACT|nr:chitobiase/beta-hexosaminidase C-terminal domain-containing protein [Geomonas silvestris]GFO59567.1 hypothetical protein GMST_18920 [Geomonas silvestris]